MSLPFEKSENEPVALVRSPRQVLRIFHMTDLHYHDFLPERMEELSAFRDMIRDLDVDLVVNTGDFFQQSDPRMAATIAAWFERIIGSECPWCLALGNHDQDADCADPKGRLLEIDAMLASLPRSLYRRSHDYLGAFSGAEFAEELAALRTRGNYKVPLHGSEAAWDGFLGGNYLVRIENGQSLAWEAFILNSRNYLHVPAKAKAWMAKIHTPGCPAVVFLHVPSRAWAEMIGRGGYVGQVSEKVCFEGEDGSFHGFLREEIRDVVACFAGHDHVNDCCGALDSILYGYGRKSGVNGYGGYVFSPRQRDADKGKTIRMGGSLICLDLRGPQEENRLSTDGPWRAFRGIRILPMEMPADLYRRYRPDPGGTPSGAR